MSSKTGGKFRKKRVNFSMVSNIAIRDENLSLKAKGLYVLIQSYISLEDFTLYKGFLQIDSPVELVKERFRKIRYKHLEYIKLVFQDFTGEISSIKNYMITTIYNAPATCDIYFDYRVKYDMCKETSQYLS